MICSKCHKPCLDSFHDFKEVCECQDWDKISKRYNWKLKFPKKKIDGDD
jgi:hypothetical protein